MPYIDEIYDVKIKEIANFYHLEKIQEACPSISVIIPIYNMGAYLNQCLESVLNQTLNNIEVICINDGSVDNSQDILNEYSWKDSRVKVFSQKNQGVSKARNRALKLASGKYVFFLDPDDWLPDERVFDDLFRAAENNGAQICGGGFEELRGDDLITEWKDSSAKYVFHKEGFIQYREYQYDYGWVRFIYRRALLIENDLKLPTLKFFEDPVFFVKAMHTAKKFYALPRMSYCYRSGHHSYDLSYEKVVDLLEGLTRNIKLALDNQYYELLRLEVFRLTNDYAGQIAKYLGEYEDNQELVSKFNILNQLLGRNTRLEYEVFQSVINWLNYQVFIHSSGKKVLKNALKSRVKKYLKIFLPNRTVNYIRKMRNK
jgi:glycosyltransferase involved in cell wall biosynthesis